MTDDRPRAKRISDGLEVVAGYGMTMQQFAVWLRLHGFAAERHKGDTDNPARETAHA